MIIRTEQEHVAALARVDALIGAEAGTSDIEKELDELATAVEAYEREHHGLDAAKENR